jgi:hypothetical protein
MTGHMVRREGWMKRDSSCKHRLHHWHMRHRYCIRAHGVMVLTVATAIGWDLT